VNGTKSTRRDVSRLLLAAGMVALVVFIVFNLLRWFLPARVVSLRETVWNVESVAGSRVEGLAATFAFGVGAAILDSECSRRTFGWDIDGDDVGIGFWLMSTDARTCSPTAAALEQSIVTALVGVNHWGIENSDLIELKGEATIRMKRSALPAPSPPAGMTSHGQTSAPVTFARAD
jgi:heat shock protein HslJ